MKAEAIAANRAPGADEIRSRPCPNCCLCGALGEPLYNGLTDRLFDAPGEWNLKRCSDSNCGLLWLDPMPLEEDIGIAYRTYFTHAAPEGAPPPLPPRRRRRAAEFFRSAYRAWRFNYGDGAGKPFRWLLALPILFSRIECDGLDIPLRYLAATPRGRMLDVGCGDGSIVKLAQDLGWHAEGVDVDPEAVKKARRKGLTVRQGKIERQGYPADSFDLVLMNHVIEHVHDPLGTLTEIRRVLRPGGVAVVTTPNAGSWGHRRFGRYWRGLEPPRHLHIFNGHNLCALTKSAGLAGASISSTLRITGYFFVQSRRVLRFGRGEDGQATTPGDAAIGRVAAFAEMLVRAWDSLAADELLIEACK
jgi:SAM-dependent methyltransferase